jgi:hypothetical protein
VGLPVESDRPAAEDVNIQWTRELADVMRPFTTGSDSSTRSAWRPRRGRIKAAFEVNYDRLVALKNKYDPTKVFRRNQNIRPTVQGQHFRAAPEIRNDFVLLAAARARR